MMDSDVYLALCAASSDLFKNSLVLPVGIVVAREIQPEGTVSISEIREALAGRVEGNQIREALNRITAIRALTHFPSILRSQGHVWRRDDHAFWAFAQNWGNNLEEAAKAVESK